VLWHEKLSADVFAPLACPTKALGARRNGCVLLKRGMALVWLRFKTNIP
jgi:hypothetical protein